MQLYEEAKVQFIQEDLLFTGEDSPIYQLLLSVMGALAEFERSLIKERQKRIEITKKKVVHKGRTKALMVE